MSDEYKLKPCPFCGEQPRVRDALDGGYVLEHGTLTTEPDCLISVANWYPTASGAVAAWNRRYTADA